MGILGVKNLGGLAKLFSIAHIDILVYTILHLVLIGACSCALAGTD